MVVIELCREEVVSNYRLLASGRQDECLPYSVCTARLPWFPVILYNRIVEHVAPSSD